MEVTNLANRAGVDDLEVRLLQIADDAAAVVAHRSHDRHDFDARLESHLWSRLRYILRLSPSRRGFGHGRQEECAEHNRQGRHTLHARSMFNELASLVACCKSMVYGHFISLGRVSKAAIRVKTTGLSRSRCKNGDDVFPSCHANNRHRPAV